MVLVVGISVGRNAHLYAVTARKLNKKRIRPRQGSVTTMVTVSSDTQELRLLSACTSNTGEVGVFKAKP